MVFFAKDKKMAIARNKRVAKEESMIYNTPTLAKKQIKHNSGWKTWKDNMVYKKTAKLKTGNKLIGYTFSVKPNYKGFPYATFPTKTEGISKLRKAGYVVSN